MLLKTNPFIAFMGIVVILVGIIIKLVLQNMQYAKLEYNFYLTKVEYKDGFLDQSEKELKYKFIREVTVSQGIFERMFHIGTIKIFTNASNGGYRNKHSTRMANGIAIHCIEDVKEQYQAIKRIIDEGTEEE